VLERSVSLLEVGQIASALSAVAHRPLLLDALCAHNSMSLDGQRCYGELTRGALSRPLLSCVRCPDERRRSSSDPARACSLAHYVAASSARNE
jgi:hypothetical protein